MNFGGWGGLVVVLLFVQEASVPGGDPLAPHYAKCKPGGTSICLYQLLREVESKPEQECFWAGGVALQWFGKQSEF